MPTQYGEFEYDYRVDGSFTDWLETKDDDGWELVSIIRMRSDRVNYHICSCVFRKGP